MDSHFQYTSIFPTHLDNPFVFICIKCEHILSPVVSALAEEQSPATRDFIFLALCSVLDSAFSRQTGTY